MLPSRPLLLLLLFAPLLPACTSGGDEPKAERFSPPPASAFAGGPCELVQDDVVALGRASHDLRGVAAPDQAARDLLLSAQERVNAVAETASDAVKPALNELVLATGLVRLQSDTRMLTPETVDGMRTAYETALQACRASATPAPSAG